jgi:hypothetical protein
MTRTAAIVISLILGLPILAMVAVASVGGFDPKLLTTFLVGGVVMVFVVGAIFEIKRLLDSDDHPSADADAGHGKSHAITVADAPASDLSAPREIETAPLIERESVEAELAADNINVTAPAPEPIIVEHEPEVPPMPVATKQAAKTGRAKRVSVSPAEPEPGVATAPKPKRKSTRTKQATPV